MVSSWLGLDCTSGYRDLRLLFDDAFFTQQIDHGVRAGVDAFIGCVKRQISIARSFVVGGNTWEIQQFARVGFGVLAFGVSFAADFHGSRNVNDQETFFADQLGDFQSNVFDGSNERGNADQTGVVERMSQVAASSQVLAAIVCAIA